MKKNLAIKLEGLLRSEYASKSFSNGFLGRLPTKTSFHAITSTKGNIGEFEVACALAKQLHDQGQSVLIISNNQWLSSEIAKAQELGIHILNHKEEYIDFDELTKRLMSSSAEIAQVCYQWTFGFQSIEELVESFDLNLVENIILLQNSGGAIPAQMALKRLLPFCSTLHVPAIIGDTHWELEPLFDYLKLLRTNNKITLYPFNNREALFSLRNINIYENDVKWEFLDDDYLSVYEDLHQTLGSYNIE
ncbi:hypothetical protein L9G16_16915 [Shewanella sp. A25]|nr:hypothetical protein [Shewanella shenzhenensis]